MNISLAFDTMMHIKGDEEHHFVNSLRDHGQGLSKDTITESSADFNMSRPTCWLRHSFMYKTNSKGERTQHIGDPVEETRVTQNTTDLHRLLCFC